MSSLLISKNKKGANMAKHTLFLAAMLLLLTACSKKEETVPVEHYYPGGQLFERYQVLKGTNVKHGPHEEWFEGGNIKRQFNWKYDKRDGKYMEWSSYTGGKKIEAYYKDGMLDGPYTEWFSDRGSRTEVKEYRQDKLYKVTITWFHDNTRKATEAVYDHEDGQITKTIWDRTGVKTKKIVWDKDGKEVKTYD